MDVVMFLKSPSNTVFDKQRFNQTHDTVSGTSTGVKILAVFVSKSSGEALKKYAGDPDMEIWIIPSLENSAWSIMATSFIALLAMSAVLAMCFFVRRHHIRRELPRSRVREFHGISSRLVKAMPSLIFTSVVEDNSTSVTCAICLEDYSVGDKLRLLPCRHSKLSSLMEVIYFLSCSYLVLLLLIKLKVMHAHIKVIPPLGGYSSFWSSGTMAG